MTVDATRPRGRKPKGLTGTPASRLQQWLNANGFTSADLEAEITPPMSRTQVMKIRWRIGDVRRAPLIRILDAACFLAKRSVRMEEIFEIEPELWPRESTLKGDSRRRICHVIASRIASTERGNEGAMSLLCVVDTALVLPYTARKSGKMPPGRMLLSGEMEFLCHEEISI